MSYEVPQVEGLTVYFNGINVTEENIRVVGRSNTEILAAIQQGARYSFGARYTF
jgi:hypothetical protein